ncbi:MAG: homoserine O-succinyltransferase, partial [Rhizobiaceae bacterium]
MPIRIPDHLPARKTLENEGVVVMDSSRASRQDIRPLRIGLLNLMPNKERTETQFARLIGSTPLQIDLTLVRITEHVSKHTSEEYLNTFYSTWESVRERKFDGFIVTGAPVANIPFEEVRYWPEMLDIMNWTGSNVHQTMFICWGAQAALHHFHQAKRYRMAKKAFGVFRHKLVGGPTPWLRGFSDSPMVPVSRYNDIDKASLSKDLEILIDNEEIGVCMLADKTRRALYMLN